MCAHSSLCEYAREREREQERKRKTEEGRELAINNMNIPSSASIGGSHLHACFRRLNFHILPLTTGIFMWMCLTSAYASAENAAVLYGEHHLKASQTHSVTRLFIHFLLLFVNNVKQ